MGDSGDFWRDVKEWHKERRDKYRVKTLPSDTALLKKHQDLGDLIFVTHNDGAGGLKYLIEIETDRGPRSVTWWASSGKWKVKGGRAEGYGVYRLLRYFQIIKKEVQNGQS